MGWTVQRAEERWRVKEAALSWAMISKGPRNFLKNFGVGHVEEMYLACMNALSPILKSGSVF